MKGVTISLILFFSVIFLGSCSDDVTMMEEEMEENPMDTTVMPGLEPIGIDTNSLTACNPELAGPFKNGTCRLKVIYNITETKDPQTGETIINKTPKYNFVYNDAGQLVYHEGLNFRDSITYLLDGSIYQVIRMRPGNSSPTPDQATYYYHDNGNISHIHYDKWNWVERVDSFYYDINQQVSRITQWKLNDEGTIDTILSDFSYDYFDKGSLRRVKRVSHECVDYCGGPITTFLYFWNYTDLKPIDDTGGFYHNYKIQYDNVMLNLWRYEFNSDELWSNSGSETDLSAIEYNEYGYLTNPYYEWECFD